MLRILERRQDRNGQGGELIVETIGETCCLGESPIWHPNEQCLYWCDVERGRLLRFGPAGSTIEELYRGEPIGGITLEADESLLLFMARGAVRKCSKGQLSTIIEDVPDERETRFNDVIAALLSG